MFAKMRSTRKIHRKMIVPDRGSGYVLCRKRGRKPLSGGRDGMVDIPDLKSVGALPRVGSSPTARTILFMVRNTLALVIPSFDPVGPSTDAAGIMSQ